MRKSDLRSPALVLVAVLLPASARANDAAAPPLAPTAVVAPPNASAASSQSAAAPAPQRPAAAKPQPRPKPAAKPPAKPSAKDRLATLKKKPRAAGPPREPDPSARRAVAGPTVADERASGADTPEMLALKQAERELFGPPPSTSSPRSHDLLPPPLGEADRPAVFASGLPPPFASPAPPPDRAATDTSWLSSLSQPDLAVRWNGRVVQYLSFYRSDPRGRSIAAAWLKRSGAYDALVRRVLRSQGLPEDLIWVALVESGFSPTAYSPAGAAGLWQFMPSTARLYGLVVDRWVDERLDPERATVAAARFLSDLHHRFGSWELALAAYNMGFGGLLAAVRKYNTNDFWELCRFEAGLPWETSLYVPKIAAFAIVARNPAAFGLEGIVRDAPLAADGVDVAPGLSLASLATAAGVDTAAIEALNPQLLASRAPPQPSPMGGGLWPVRVPAGAGSRTERNLLKSRSLEPPLDRYVVRQGESLADIAHSRGVSETQLERLNGLQPDDEPRPSAVLLVPARTSARTSATQDKPIVSLPSDLQAPPGFRRMFYRVVAGDTVAAVAEGFGCSVDELRRWNLLDPIARLQEGMTLMVMVPVTRDVSSIVARSDDEVRVLLVGSDPFFDHHEALRDRVRTTLVVRPSESWPQIAARTGLSIAMLERINRRSRHSRLLPGEKLVAYVASRGLSAGRPAPLGAPGTAHDTDTIVAPAPEDLPELPEPGDPIGAQEAQQPGAPRRPGASPSHAPGS
jgi:membrane-bound lytic murein transglycosylase D